MRDFSLLSLQLSFLSVRAQKLSPTPVVQWNIFLLQTQLHLKFIVGGNLFNNSKFVIPSDSSESFWMGEKNKKIIEKGWMLHYHIKCSEWHRMGFNRPQKKIVWTTKYLGLNERNLKLLFFILFSWLLEKKRPFLGRWVRSTFNNPLDLHTSTATKSSFMFSILKFSRHRRITGKTRRQNRVEWYLNWMACTFLFSPFSSLRHNKKPPKS